MKRYIKKIIKKLNSISFVWRVFGSLFRADGVIVLMYHRIGDEHGIFPGFSVDNFREQMNWVKVNCNVIHPDNFKDSLKKNNKFKPNVLITFDDGYQCCYKYAYPILKKMSLPALVFLATQPPDEGGLIWTDKLYYLVYKTTENTVKLPWNNEKVVLELDNDKNKLLLKMKKYLKNIDNKSRVEYMVELESVFKVSSEHKLNRQMLSWDEVRDSLNTVCYGGHTHTHPIMSKITKDELENEILTCRDRIFDETGIYPTSFAYPNGKSTDYNCSSIELLEKYGFELAYTTNEGLNDTDTKLMEIKRVPTRANNLEDFVWLISTAGCK